MSEAVFFLRKWLFLDKSEDRDEEACSDNAADNRTDGPSKADSYYAEKSTGNGTAYDTEDDVNEKIVLALHDYSGKKSA